MAGEVDTGMDKQDLKRLLKKSKEEPVNCAFGQGKDRTIALLLLDKVKGPRGVEKDLIKQFPDASNTRFGVAIVNEDEDPKLVKFRINKAVSGAAKKLVKTLKGTGYNKVEILLDDGTLVEKDAEAEEQEQTGKQTEDEPTAPPQTTGGPPPPPPPPQQPQAPQYDKDKLTAAWNEQVKRIPEALAKAPLLKEQLTKYATDGQVNLKTNNLAYAAAAIEQLRRALDAVKGGATGANREALEKSSKLWHATRAKLESEIEKLRGEIVTTYEKTDMAAKIDAAYRERAGGVLDMLDESLSLKLESAATTLDPAAQKQLIVEAKAMIKMHQNFVANDDTITELDTNPFAPLQLRATATGMLAALEKAVA